MAPCLPRMKGLGFKSQDYTNTIRNARYKLIPQCPLGKGLELLFSKVNTGKTYFGVTGTVV